FVTFPAYCGFRDPVRFSLLTPLPFLPNPRRMTEHRPWFRPRLTRPRVALAFATAILADLVQLVLGPLGWVLPDEIIDVVAMGTITLAIGYHPLLLPTFLLDFLPFADVLPTWTAGVMAVLALRQT